MDVATHSRIINTYWEEEKNQNSAHSGFLMSVSISIKIKNEAEIFRSFYARNAINHRQSIWYTQTLAHRPMPKLQHSGVSIAVIVWLLYRVGAEGEGSSCSSSNPLLRENS